MPKVVFEGQQGNPITVDAPDGSAIADLCDAHNAPIPFSCRSASCGTCRCEVLEGGALLAPADDEELDVLDILGAPKTHRLACCAKLVGASGTVRLRPINEY